MIKFASAATCALSLALGAGAARADFIGFDEFASPPVTCCYGDTGVAGPLNYTHVKIQDVNSLGYVMNGDGWNNEQTSGQNLFGTRSGSIIFDFNTAVSGLNFDLINGAISPATYTVELYSAGFGLLGTHSYDLNSFTLAGDSVHLGFSESGIGHVLVSGSDDIAVDSIGFDAGRSGAPEPAGWALMIMGFGLAGAALRRRAVTA